MKIAILKVLVEYLETEKVDKETIRRIKNFDIHRWKEIKNDFKKARKENKEELDLLFKQQ